ncbi:hypothetical protein DPMN_099980 [Dreissena polymorpha]|uniref:Uncharacterized protein n=1 Tax=Dreissena polymorpha TaxID=45954 RepID=A0A9D4LGN0_DREPO|nr:hypothetical protein DPMN_099980 [Dreissena polymorpha]
MSLKSQWLLEKGRERECQGLAKHEEGKEGAEKPRGNASKKMRKKDLCFCMSKKKTGGCKL